MLPSSRNTIHFILFFLLCSCGNGKNKDQNKLHFDSAREYNTYINKQFEEVNRLWNASLTHMDDSSTIYTILDSLSKVSDTCASNMTKLSDYKGDTMYKMAAGHYFLYIRGEGTAKLKEAVDIGLLTNVSDSLYFRFGEIGRQIGEEKERYITELKQAQLHFIRITAK